MEKCPFCAEEIQDEAIKCKHCGEWLKSKKNTDIGSPLKAKHEVKDSPKSSFICAKCNSLVDEGAKLCPVCQEKFEEEPNFGELKDIIKKGPDKAHTDLVAFSEMKEKYKSIALGQLLIKEFPDSKQSRWAKEILEKAHGLKPKKIRFNPQTQKLCINCKRVLPIQEDICPCGYNFAEPNLEAIQLIKKQRVWKNRISGLGMLVFGALLTLMVTIPAYSNPINRPDKPIWDMVYLAPIFLAIVGLYKLLTGKIVKTPTKSPLDYWIGDGDNAKDTDDDMSYTYCPSCKKQIFRETKLDKCPYCGSKLNSRD